MKPEEIEALYMTIEEAAEYLNVDKSRVRKMSRSGYFAKLKGNVYDRSGVEAYKVKRGDKKGGRYPKQTDMIGEQS